MTQTGRVPASVWAAYAVLYSVLTVAYAWPLFRAFATTLPHDPGDPSLTTWMMWWNSQAVPLTTRWWNAPIFYPIHGAFAMSETLVGLSIVTTPLHWLGAGAVTAANVAFLVSFPLTAMAGHALAHRLTGRHDAGLIAGLALGFNPYRAAQMPHIQMEWAMFMPFCLLALHRYIDERRPRDLALAALCWVLNALCSAYFLVFFGVLVAGWMLWNCRTWREWTAVGGVLAVATALLSPLLWGYAHYQALLGLSRGRAEIEAFSADLSAYWSTSTEAWLSHHWTKDPYPEGAFYPGVVVAILAAAGAVVAWRRAKVRSMTRLQVALSIAATVSGLAAIAAYRRGGVKTTFAGIGISLLHPERALVAAAILIIAALSLDPRMQAAWRRRSPYVFYAVGALMMALFSLGPVGRMLGMKFLPTAPYSWLMLLPGVSGMRVPARFGALAVLCIVEAGAIGFATLVPRRLARVVVALVALAIGAEGWVPDFPVAPISPLEGVRAGADVSAPVVELPMSDPYTDVAAMLRQTVHRHPLVNGYSGYGPAHYDALQEALIDCDPAALDALTSFGPLIVSIDRARDPKREQADWVAKMPGATMQYRSGLGPVYALPRTAPGPAAPVDPEIPIVFVDANQNFDAVPRLIDRNLGSWWQSQESQSAGDQVTVGFDRAMAVSRIEIDLGTSTMDYPRRLRVETADPGQPPRVVWEGRTAGLAILGAMADFARAPIALDLGSGVRTRRLTLTTLERQRQHRWSIAEIRAFGQQ